MKRTRRIGTLIALIVALVALSAVGFAAAVTGQNTATPIPKTIPPDPDQNLTTSQRATAYTQGFRDHMARRTQFIQNFQASGQDPAKLPRITKAASYVPPQSSLAEALKNADLVIDGTVTKVTFSPTSVTVATVQVNGLQKASPAAVQRLGVAQPTQVQVALGYTVEPDLSYASARLVVPENEPVLLPGDRAKLFLQPAQSNSNGFYIQSWTGGYAINGSGNIVPVPGNPFASQVQGLTVAQFTSLVTSELSKLTP